LWGNLSEPYEFVDEDDHWGRVSEPWGKNQTPFSKAWKSVGENFPRLGTTGAGVFQRLESAPRIVVTAGRWFAAGATPKAGRVFGVKDGRL
jgi:hypothetical protein